MNGRRVYNMSWEKSITVLGQKEYLKTPSHGEKVFNLKSCFLRVAGVERIT